MIQSVDISDFPHGIEALFEFHHVTLEAGEFIELPLRIQLDRMDPYLGGQVVINTDQESVEIQIGAAIYESVRWKNLTHVEVDTLGNLTKVSGNAWDAGASSSQVLEAGADGWVEIVIDRVDKNLAFGLSRFDATGSYTDFEYAVALDEQYSVTDTTGHVEHAPKLEFHSRNREGFIDFSKDHSTRDGRVSRLNALGLSQAFQPNLQDYDIGDVIRMERVGSQVIVKRNGFVVMLWSADPNQELRMDTSLLDVEAKISDARLSFNLAPQLIAMRPSDKAEQASLSDMPTLIINESVQLGHGQVEIVKASDDEVVQVIGAKDLLLDGPHLTRVLINLDSRLKSNTEYYVNVDGNSITDRHGVSFPGIRPRAWSFTTGIVAVHQNPSNRNDVNGDGIVTPFDVLVTINLLNAGQVPGGKLPEFDDVIRGANKVFADVNGDGFLSPNDVIRVANYLNRPR